jgi:hypothetical protein
MLKGRRRRRRRKEKKKGGKVGRIDIGLII